MAHLAVTRVMPNLVAANPAFQQEQDRIYNLFLSLWENIAAAGAPICPCCGVHLTVEHQQQENGSDRQAHPTNASPNRINNSVGYHEGNVRLTCIACNLLRQRNSTTGAADHVDRLKKAWRSGSWKLQDGFLSSTALAVTPTSRGLEGIDTWARSQLNSIRSRCIQSEKSGEKIKRCLVELQDLKEMIKACWAGDGRFFDVTGAAFAIGCASLDRINSDGDYEKHNCRIMHVGLNSLKNACKDDTPIVE